MPYLRSCALCLCVAIGILGSSVALVNADIPPPQHFVPSAEGSNNSKRVLVVSADDSIEMGEQEHPSGSEFATSGYCSVRLDVLEGSGANAILNAVGSSDPEAMFGAKGWVPESPPVTITNKQSSLISSQISIPLRHKLISFFLSVPASPGTPDVGASVGESILVYATAIACQ